MQLVRMASNGDIHSSTDGGLSIERLGVKDNGLTLAVLGCGEYVHDFYCPSYCRD